MHFLLQLKNGSRTPVIIMKPWVVLRFVAWNSCPIGAYRSYDKAGDSETNPPRQIPLIRSAQLTLEKCELMSHLQIFR